jgi:uncharacterized protein YcfJ
MKTYMAIGVITLGILVGMGGAQSAMADNTFYARAKVVDVEPVYETERVVIPEETCWRERVVRPGDGYHSYSGTIAGGLVGGLVGNQFGNGSRRKVLTVAGSLLGASLGRDLTHRYERPRATTQRYCETVDRIEYEEHLVGYRVKYRYKGNVFVTHSDHHPGEHIRVRVTVDPTSG